MKSASFDQRFSFLQHKLVEKLDKIGRFDLKQLMVQRVTPCPILHAVIQSAFRAACLVIQKSAKFFYPYNTVWLLYQEIQQFNQLFIYSYSRKIKTIHLKSKTKLQQLTATVLFR